VTPTEKKLARKRTALREIEALIAEIRAEGSEPGTALLADADELRGEVAELEATVKRNARRNADARARSTILRSFGVSRRRE